MVFQVRSTWQLCGREEKWPHLRQEGSVAENRDEKRQKILSLSISRKILEEYHITILDF